MGTPSKDATVRMTKNRTRIYDRRSDTNRTHSYSRFVLSRSCKTDSVEGSLVSSPRCSVHLVSNRSVSGRSCSVDTVLSRLMLSRSPPDHAITFSFYILRI